MKINGDFYGCKYEAKSTLPKPSLNLIREAFEIIRPKPSPVPLIRIGGAADGAYLIPDDLAGVHACFSPGVNNFKAFEDELSNTYGIESHMCDFSSDEDQLSTPLIPGLQTFKKLWLDVAPTANAISLPEWIAELGGDTEDDLMLQIDIEGAEYRNILSCPKEVLSRFRIIAIELHSLEFLAVSPVLEEIFLKFLRKISEDFICVHAHPNNCCGEISLPGIGANMPRLIELTFLRRDRFALNVSGLFPALIPNPLDIDRNVVANAPIVLNENWVDGDRSDLSKIKILEESLSYQTFSINHLEEKVRELQSVITLIGITDKERAGILESSKKSHRARTKLVEIAAGCHYALSSSYVPGCEQGVIPLAEAETFFFHTDFGSDQWIKIDLGGAHRVQAIEIVNRKDMCFDRARSLYVFLYRDDPNQTIAAYPVEPTAGFKSGSISDIRIPVAPTVSTHVAIRSVAFTALHFAYIRIYAEVDQPLIRKRRKSAVA